MTTAKKRGALIVFEGLDRSGKSTQIERLVTSLGERKVPVKRMAFPDRKTDTGKIIDEYLKLKRKMDDKAIHLLFAANRWEQKLQMERDLADGYTLVVDRYSYSGVAYSAAKGLDIEWCRAPEKGFIHPDVVFFMQTDPSQFEPRLDDQERYETREFQTSVSIFFDRMHEEEQSYWETFDARRTPDEQKNEQNIESIAREIERKALEVIAAAGNTPIKALWP